MINKFYYTLFSLVLIVAQASGQQLVSGKVLDAQSGQPLESAVVVAGKRTATTDAQGSFAITLPRDSGLVTVSIIGYQPAHIMMHPGIVNRIVLEKVVVNLREVIITPGNNITSNHNITQIDLNTHVVNSSQDLMRLVPGLFLGQHQGGGIAEHIFFRGFDADHGTDVNVSVDGMPVNLVSQAHGQGFSDLHFLIPELVTQYEFGKGPYYAPYGDFETAGFISFKTADVLTHSTVKVEAGQFNTKRAVALLNLLGHRAMRRGENAYIAVEDAYTDGPFDTPQRFNRFNLFGKYHRRLGAKNTLGITLSTYNSDWKSSGEIPERAVAEGITDRFGYIDSAQGGHTDRSNAIIRLTTELAPRLVMENQVYFSDYFFNLHYDATLFADDSINGDQLRQRESRSLAGYNGTLEKHDYFPGGFSLTSTAGWGFQTNRIRHSELSHTKDLNTVLEYLQLGNVRETVANAYIDENLGRGNWLLDAGARLDYLYFNYQDLLNAPLPSQSKMIVSPKINLEYTPSHTIQFYLKTGKGFHSNDAKAVIDNHGSDILPAAYGTDLGINWKPVSRLFINAAVWYLQLQQEFVYDADEGTLDEGGKTRRQGVDVSARYQLSSWLFASADVNFCRARAVGAPKGDNYLPLAVPFSSTAALDFKLRDGLNGGISYRWMGDRPATSDNQLVAQGYFVTDLNCNYTRKRFELGIEIQNLFNTKWREAQFEVTSRLKNEPAPVDDISFTAGTPFFAKLKAAWFF